MRASCPKHSNTGFVSKVEELLDVPLCCNDPMADVGCEFLYAGEKITDTRHNGKQPSNLLVRLPNQNAHIETSMFYHW